MYGGEPEATYTEISRERFGGIGMMVTQMNFCKERYTRE